MNYVSQTVLFVAIAVAVVVALLLTVVEAATAMPAVVATATADAVVLVVCPLALLCGNKLALKISNKMQRKSRNLHATDFNLLVLCSIHLRIYKNKIYIRVLCREISEINFIFLFLLLSNTDNYKSASKTEKHL